MQTFLTEVRLNHQLYNVQFSKIYAPGVPRYFVVVSNHAREKYSFEMKKDGERWRIIQAPRVSLRFTGIEEQLSALLCQQLR